MQLIHEMYTDYERLLHANPQRGYDFFYSTLLNPSLREPMLTSEASLQAIFCGCNEKGHAIFPNAYNINDLLVDEGYMDQALGNYLTFLGYSNPGNSWATFLKNNYTTIFANKAACAAVLQSRTAMQLFATDATLWAAIVANTAYFKRCMCSYYFCEKLAATPAKIGDIRANSSLLTAFNTNKDISTSTKTIVATQSEVFFCMFIGQGGTGGAGGYGYSQNCSSYYVDATAGVAGNMYGTAGKPRYGYDTSSYGKYKNAGGGGGRAGVIYRAVRVKKGARLTCGISTNPSLSGYDKLSNFTKAASNTQSQILPDIVTGNDSTSGAATANGYDGYGYGSPASGNNFLGTPTAASGQNKGYRNEASAGTGGKGVGAGGGGGSGGPGSNTSTGSNRATGGAGAPGCIGLYRGA